MQCLGEAEGCPTPLPASGIPRLEWNGVEWVGSRKRIQMPGRRRKERMKRPKRGRESRQETGYQRKEAVFLATKALCMSFFC